MFAAAFTIPSGDHDVRVILVERQRVRGTVVQNVSVVVGRHNVVDVLRCAGFVGRGCCW